MRKEISFFLRGRMARGAATSKKKQHNTSRNFIATQNVWYWWSEVQVRIEAKADIYFKGEGRVLVQAKGHFSRKGKALRGQWSFPTLDASSFIQFLINEADVIIPTVLPAYIPREQYGAAAYSRLWFEYVSKERGLTFSIYYIYFFLKTGLSDQFHIFVLFLGLRLHMHSHFWYRLDWLNAWVLDHTGLITLTTQNFTVAIIGGSIWATSALSTCHL